MSIDKRYETNADSLGRLPLASQRDVKITPSFVVVGNIPLTLRESMLPEALAMGERLVEASKRLIPPSKIPGKQKGAESSSERSPSVRRKMVRGI